MDSLKELIKGLKKIKEMGFVKTHRRGNTGIGKTLEDILNIDENNIPDPDIGKIELKSARKNSISFLTLFTKSPLPPSANSLLLKTYGYPSSKRKDKKELHTTVSALFFNNLKGKKGFKIKVLKNKIKLISEKNKCLGYWDKETLQKSFERKLPHLVYVKAECKGTGEDEEFWFNEAWFLEGFDFDKFVSLVKKGVILIDIRIGQYSDGRPHDHGTAFRVRPDRLEQCFEHRKRIV